MIQIRSEDEIDKMRTSCRIAAEAMEIARYEVKPGITTGKIAEKVQSFIEKKGAKPAFLGYNGYPGAICVSVNEEVVHGIPGNRVLEEGDLIKLDIGTYLDGFFGDMARSYPVGKISEDIKALIETTREAFYEGVGQAVSGNHVGDIGYAVQHYAEERGYGVVRALVGHGIGRNLHEDPQVPNFGVKGSGQRLKSGMILAIEPMINMGDWEVDVLSDDWTMVTSDGKMSAHYENTCVIREGYAEILTLLSGEEAWQKTTQ
ncbi:MAG: type I methionyl aminopeptidase [Candidatus Latescibacteria bacterium]|nr:type I methionyl aminopeptidase [Candidatus Latescibacterota bacterium]